MVRRDGSDEAVRSAGEAGADARPLLGRLFPTAQKDPETMEKIAANVSANLLGLGNVATPLGIQAVRRMSRATKGVGL